MEQCGDCVLKTIPTAAEVVKVQYVFNCKSFLSKVCLRWYHLIIRIDSCRLHWLLHRRRSCCYPSKCAFSHTCYIMEYWLKTQTSDCCCSSINHPQCHRLCISRRQLLDTRPIHDSNQLHQPFPKKLGKENWTHNHGCVCRISEHRNVESIRASCRVMGIQFAWQTDRFHGTNCGPPVFYSTFSVISVKHRISLRVKFFAYSIHNVSFLLKYYPLVNQILWCTNQW